MQCHPFSFPRACAALLVLGSWATARRVNRTQPPSYMAKNSLHEKWRGNGGIMESIVGVKWKPSWGPCSTTCGAGEQDLVHMVCVNLLGNEVDEDACASTNMEVPAMVQECEDVSGCAWQCVQRADKCGWGAAVCMESSSKMEVELRWCHKAFQLPQADRFVRDSLCASRKGCKDKDFPSSVRAVTLNLPDKFASDKERGGLENLLRQTYNAEDFLVIATQELTHKGFDKYMVGRIIPPNGGDPLLLVGTCLKSISSGTALYVKEKFRRIVAPVHNGCWELAGGASFAKTLGVGGNIKGTHVMVVRTLTGPFILASSHLHRSGVMSATRVREFILAAEKIKGMLQTEHLTGVPGVKGYVFWAGDINTRTQVRDISALAPGITHPPETLTGVTDDLESLVYEPSKALKAYTSAFRDELGDGRTVDEVLRDVLGYQVVQVPGLLKKCPTYYKDSKEGSVKTSWKLEKSWSPHWACQESPQMPIEYHKLPTLEEMQGDSSRAPSWTERIFVGGVSCKPVEKWTQKKDHDVLHAQCSLQAGVVPMD